METIGIVAAAHPPSAHRLVALLRRLWRELQLWWQLRLLWHYLEALLT